MGGKRNVQAKQHPSPCMISACSRSTASSTPQLPTVLQQWPSVPWLLRHRCQVHWSTATTSFSKRFCAPFSSKFLWSQSPQYWFVCFIHFSIIHQFYNGIQVAYASTCPRFHASCIISTNLIGDSANINLSPQCQMWAPLRLCNKNLWNFKHLLTICCTCQSLLRPWPLPVSHEKKFLAILFVESKETIALFLCGVIFWLLASFVGFINIRRIDFHTV